MTSEAIILFAFLMLLVSGFFILLLLTWNKKSLESQKHVYNLQTQQHKALLRATIRGQEVEKKRLSQYLHDDIGPLLSALKMQAKTLLPDEEAAIDFYHTLELAVSQVRRVSSRMTPLIHEELGLSESIKYIIKNIGKYSTIQVHFNWNPKIEACLEEEKALCVFRIIQEALTNIYRHSHAHDVWVIGQFHESDDLIFIIKDNGIGFLPDLQGNGIGLNNMRARAESVNGRLTITSEPQNTQITFIVKKDTNHD